ncbi:hypothetical protein BK005_01895 [bacterium CG10_37_50]|nr:MAG: hypothetical protein BK005_01895 [bacterium CG10_37_50]
MSNLITKVSRNSSLKKAWFNIKHRPDSRGLDRVTIDEFESNLSDELSRLRQNLLSGRYKFTPLKGVAIDKESGAGKRPLKVPAVRDRVIQKSIELVIRPFIKRKYKIENPASFAYIRNRSVEDAIKKIIQFRKEGYGWVYKADIEKFFDTVDVNLLLNELIYPCLPDDSLNQIIKDALTIELGNVEALEKAKVYDIFPGSGIPQGGTLSPLFANVYLNPFDMEMLGNDYKLVRYADDLIVLCKDESEAKNADALARRIIEKDLKLKIHPTKIGKPRGKEKNSHIMPAKEFEFLGIRFQGSKIYPAPSKFEKVVSKIKMQAKNPEDFNLIGRLNYLKSIVERWGANYHYTDYDKALYAGLDKHLEIVVRQMFINSGYEFSKKITPEDSLKKVGLITFKQSLNHYKGLIAYRREARKKTAGS